MSTFFLNLLSFKTPPEPNYLGKVLRKQGKFFSILCLLIGWSYSTLHANTTNTCTITEGCMDFTFLDKTDNGDGTSTLCFELVNHCDKALTWVAFGIPEPAIMPSSDSTYASPISGVIYQIQNTANNPFTSLKYKTTATGIINGESDQFCFELNTELADSLFVFPIQGKAANYVNTIAMNIADCTNEYPCLEYGGDYDGDGVCAMEDCDDENPNLPAPFGTMCDDQDPATSNDYIQEDGCTCMGTIPVDCNAVTDGGVIGFGDDGSATSTVICKDSLLFIQNSVSPGGQIDSMEVVWIKSESIEDCGGAFSELEFLNIGAIYDQYNQGGSAQIDGTSWEFVEDTDTNAFTLTLGSLDYGACFVRLTRGLDCEDFVAASNIVSVKIDACSADGDGDCMASDDCMDFAYAGATNHSDSTTTICIDITNNCDHALSYAAFDIMGFAVGPEDGTTVEGNIGVSYHIENTTNNPWQHALKFEVKDEGYKNGETDQFCFELETSVADTLTSLRMQAKAGSGRYTVTLDLSDCDDDMPEEPCTEDMDGDGVCAEDDCDDTDPLYPATPGAVCDDGDSTTVNDMILEDGCSCQGTVVPPPGECDNVTSGGIVGLGEGGIFTSIVLCADSALFIQNNVDPAGGTGDLEVVWIKSDRVDDCPAAFGELGLANIGELYDNYIQNGGSPQLDTTSWEFVENMDSTDLNFALPSLENSACFVRLTRRVGCVPFGGLSNIVSVEIDDCNITIPLTEETEFNVYPNPASQFINLNLENFVGQQIKVSLLDLTGNKVKDLKIKTVISPDVLINTVNLAPGFYTVTINTASSRPVSRTFLIVK